MKKIDSLPLYVTEDYSIFKFIDTNRETNKSQISKLVRVIREKGNITEVSPILVNEKFEIIDGQHRVKAFQRVASESKVSTPIHFIVREGLRAPHAMQLNAGSKPWNPDDYARFHSKNGNRNYTIFLHFRERFELNADVLIKYLSPVKGNRSDFQAGDFEVIQESESRRWCSRLETLKPYFSDYQHRSFALAFLDIVSHKDYNHTRMIDQLDSYASELVRIPLKNKPMREALIEIYNKRVADKTLFN